MIHKISRSMLFGAVVGCVLVGLFTIVGLRLARPLIHNAIVEYRISGIDFSKCTESPESWGWASGEVSLHAYDFSGRSRNLDAPAIDTSILERARTEGTVAMKISPNGTVFVHVRNTEGPCAVIRGKTNGFGTGPLKWTLVVLFGSTIFGAILAVFTTWLVVVRPLQKRIDSVSNAARNVGSGSFMPEADTSDALGHIANVLAESHARIIESQTALEEKNRALEHHLAGVAHDLRTPLASMHLALEALAMESTGSMQLEAQRALADAVFLASMVDNLHHATRLRHEVDVTSGRVELCDLVLRLEKRFAIVGRHRGVQVAASTPEFEIWVMCTPALAERAVANLVQNAVEHNLEGGHVAIKLNVFDQGKGFQLVVVDDGPGMPDETLASLQKESFIVDDAQSRGPGMGTMIAKAVAHRAGWSVRYTQLTPTGLQVQIEGLIAPGS